MTLPHASWNRTASGFLPLSLRLILLPSFLGRSHLWSVDAVKPNRNPKWCQIDLLALTRSLQLSSSTPTQPQILHATSCHACICRVVGGLHLRYVPASASANLASSEPVARIPDSLATKAWEDRFMIFILIYFSTISW